MWLGLQPLPHSYSYHPQNLFFETLYLLTESAAFFPWLSILVEVDARSDCNCCPLQANEFRTRDLSSPEMRAGRAKAGRRDSPRWFRMRLYVLASILLGFDIFVGCSSSTSATALRGLPAHLGTTFSAAILFRLSLRLS